MARKTLSPASGGAYMLVVVSSLVVLTLVLTVLNITTTSRRITQQYEQFIGLYDLAIGGTDRIFRKIEQNFQAADYPCLDEVIAANFEQIGTEYRYSWWLETTLYGTWDKPIIDSFLAQTTLRRTSGGFYIQTTVSTQNHSATARARIKFLDENTLAMVELVRII